MDYDKRFDEHGQAFLRNHDVSPEAANGFDPRFNIADITVFAQNRCAPEKANEFAGRFPTWAICLFVERGCTLAIAEEYKALNNRLNGGDIFFLHAACIRPTLAKQYVDRFDGLGTTLLVLRGVPAEKAKLYPRMFSGQDISVLHTMKMDPDTVRTASSEVKRALKSIFELPHLLREFDEYEMLGTGYHSAVIMHTTRKIGWKCSRNARKEYAMLALLERHWKGTQKNVIRPMGAPVGNFAFPVEAIRGPSLERLVQQADYCPTPSTIYKYAADIMNGLLEMKAAGIYYHRDLRPGNILIDRQNERAVIIDFAMASVDSQAMRRGNRRFGGWNDCISLGQIMYWMAAKHHIFDESRSQSMTLSRQADRINDYRNKVYTQESGELLNMHITQIDLDLPGIEWQTVRALTKACLQETDGDYNKIAALFRRYAR